MLLTRLPANRQLAPWAGPSQTRLSFQPRPTALVRASTLDKAFTADPVAWPTSGRNLNPESVTPAKAVEPTPGHVAAPSPPERYNWNRQWYPAIPVSYLDPAKPHALTLVGKRLVLWHDSILGWRAAEDRCPHRLAPLSEGRVEQTAGGTRLACAYHGWEFDANGSCTRIPQLADPKAIATACNSPRSCVTNYPTRVADGLLFAWLDGSPEGLAAAAVAPPPYVVPEAVNSPMEWGMNEVPNDYSFWLEQGMDPAHANFLHHRPPAFEMEKAVPMAADLVPDSSIDLQNGFTWAHRGYEERNKDMRATREFHPPTGLRSAYDMPNGMRSVLCTYYVPVSPSRSRTFFKIAFGKADPPPTTTGAASSGPSAAAAASISAAADAAQGSAKQAGAELTDTASAILNTGSNGSGSSAATVKATAPAAAKTATSSAVNQGVVVEKSQSVGNKLMMFLLSKAMALSGKVPHWVSADQLLGDQDVVMMAEQEAVMREQGLGYKQYALFARSDEGVIAVNKWMRKAGYGPAMWAAQLAGGTHQAAKHTSSQGVQSNGNGSHSAAEKDGRGNGASDGSASLDMAKQQQLLAGGGTSSSSSSVNVYPKRATGSAAFEAIFDRHDRHVKHCRICQEGLQTVNKMCAGLGAAAIISTFTSLASFAATVATAAATSQALQPIALAPPALALGLAALFGVLLAELWAFRTDRFISGYPRWQERGGFSLVPRS